MSLSFFATTITCGATKTSLGDYITNVASGAGHTNTGLTQAVGIDVQAASTNTGTVAVGDSSITTSDSGRVLAASGVISFTKYDREVKISLADIYLLPSTTGQKVNVTLTL